MTNYTNLLMAKTIKSLRVKNKISVKTILVELCISQSSYSRIESGTTNISVFKLLLFCNVVGITIDDFFKTMNNSSEKVKITI